MCGLYCMELSIYCTFTAASCVPGVLLGSEELGGRGCPDCVASLPWCKPGVLRRAPAKVASSGQVEVGRRMRVRARETSAGRHDALVRSEKTRRPPAGGRRRDLCSRWERQSTQKDRNDVCAGNCGPSIQLECEVHGGTEPEIFGWGDKQGRWWRARRCRRVGTSPHPPTPRKLPVQEVGWCRGPAGRRPQGPGQGGASLWRATCSVW